MNRAVVAKFIEETHKKYYDRFKKDFGTALIGFFTDEPQYFRWDTAFTPVIIDEFKKEYDEDILDTLGALFVDCVQAYELRYRYWHLMNKLLVNSFARQIYEWCEEHNCKLTGHAIEEQAIFTQMWCCAGVMPFYEYERIPDTFELYGTWENGRSPLYTDDYAFVDFGVEEVILEVTISINY